MAPSGNDAGDRDGAEGTSGDSRLAAAPDSMRAPRLPFPVVGVGASAGGLEAYSEFLRAVPSDIGMAFVLVQHLPPDRESLLVELLAKQTTLPVEQVEDGQAVAPNHIYVIRPGHTLTLKDGRLRLGAELTARGHSRPVDDFFRSMAEEQQQRAIAVVFSGMGSNGTAGAQAVKAVGGLIVAQDPETAKFPAMPRSLIDANLADFVLRPCDVPEALARYAGHPYVRSEVLAPSPETDGQTLAEILGLLRARTRQDFAGYRRPTLLRRVQRRMGLARIVDMQEYARELRKSPGEAGALAEDLLIHVTGFFRDPDAWEALRTRVIEPLVSERPEGATIRGWVAACATGQEAYSLAMLIVEAAEAHHKEFDLKVFATDMAERALGQARAGVFPGGIESEVTPERLARFFEKDDAFYRVKRELRESVVFAPQNVLHDPPFCRLDVATCRNLLIYLEPDMQQRVLSLLHFGLREGGALMLGTSETAGPHEGGFETVDKKHRIFKRVGPTVHGALEFPLPTTRQKGTQVDLSNPPPSRATAVQLASRALLEHHTPAAAAVDAAGQIVYLHGDVGRYLRLVQGEPTHDLMALVDDRLRGKVRKALHRAAAAPNTAAVVENGILETADGRRRVEVNATPLGTTAGAPLFLVIFRDLSDSPPPTPASVAVNGEPTDDRRLVEELSGARDELQAALNEAQSSKEELKASHEELTSINEELQSTNEELETSKEEMQSLNEELITLNAQLQTKMAELEATSSDLESLLASTDIAVLFLDPSLRIRRFTPAIRALLDLIPTDVGRPAAALAWRFDDPRLEDDCRAVLERLIPIEREVAGTNERCYLRRALPYRTIDNRIGGVVVTFVDVTVSRRAEEIIRANEERMRLILASATDYAVFTLDADRRVTGWSPGAAAVFGYTEADIIGKHGDILFTMDDQAAGEPVREASAALETGRAADERWHVRRDGTQFFANGVLTPLGVGGPNGFVKVLRDLTERKHMEDDLRTARDELGLRVAARTADLAKVVDALETEIGRRRALSRQLVEAQEAERRRVSRDLHDTAGQMLIGLSLSAAALQREAGLPAAARERAEEVSALAESLSKELHALAVRLRPSALDDVGLATALTDLVQNWSTRTGVEAEVDVFGIDEERLPAEVETVVYRVAQEALTNIAKHAGATKVIVLVNRLGAEAQVAVEDNGSGFDWGAAGNRRLGLAGMRERVEVVGGTLEIESAAGSGTTVLARIPLT